MSRAWDRVWDMQRTTSDNDIAQILVIPDLEAAKRVIVGGERDPFVLIPYTSENMTGLFFFQGIGKSYSLIKSALSR